MTGRHSQINEVMSGSSYISQNDLRLHFGLGQAKQVDLVEVRWPLGWSSPFKNVDVNQLLVLQEGHGILRKEKLGKPKSETSRKGMVRPGPSLLTFPRGQLEEHLQPELDSPRDVALATCMPEVTVPVVGNPELIHRAEEHTVEGVPRIGFKSDIFVLAEEGILVD